MPLHTTLILAAGIAANMIVTQQDPMIDYQVVTPEFARLTVLNPRLSPFTQDDRISLHVQKGSVQSVLKTLEAHGFSYVIADGGFPPNQTISLSIDSASVQDIADAVAAALGGHWVNKNGVHVFEKDPFALVSPSTFSTVKSNNPPTSVFQFPKGLPFAQGLAPQDRLSQLPPASRKAIEAAMKKLRDLLQKTQTEKNGSKGSSMSPTEKAKLNGLIDQLQRELGALDPNGYSMPYRTFQYSTPQFKEYGFNQPFTWNWQTPPQNFSYAAPQAYGGHPARLGELLKSLTPHQKDLQKQQGYLKYDDLTSAQQKMLGIKSAGSFEVHYKSKDGDLTIKN